MASEIVFPPSSAPGLRPQEGGGRLINAFAEAAPVGAPAKVIHKRSPGLLKLGNSGLPHTRGFIDAGSGEVYWIVNNRQVKFNSSLVPTDVGALAGSDMVTMAKNNKSPADVVVVTSDGCFNLFSSGPPTPFGDTDLPPNPTSVCDFDGFFIWTYANGAIYASDLNTVNVAADSFTTEEGLLVRRGVRFAGNFYAFGDKWTGVYKDVGSLPFPLQRQVTIPRGIVSTHAIAGWETGWSNQLLWAGDDFVVYQLNGYTPNPISTDDVSRAIQASVAAGHRNNIVAYVYMYGSNAFWVLTCQGEWTWEYNLSTNSWNERQSYNQPCWKGLQSVRVFDRWIIGDQFSDEFYQTSESYFLEGLDPLIWQVESGVLHSFPKGIVIPRASFNMTAGVGSFATVSDPKVEISWSLDGGYSYGRPVIRRLGMPGETKSHPYVLSGGLSRGQGLRYRLRVSDAVHVGLTGGMIEGAQRSFSG